MATHVTHDSGVVERWRDLVHQAERDDFELPLPALDWIRLYEDRPPSMAIITADAEGEVGSVFVAVERMPVTHQIALFALLTALEHETDITPLAAIYHLDGLDYSFSSRDPEETASLKQIHSSRHQAVIWGLLHSLAALGAQYAELVTGAEPDSGNQTPYSQR